MFTGMDQAKFAQWREHLERTYGKHTFVSRAWIRSQINRLSAAAVPSRVPSETLESIRADLGACLRCKLCSTRKNLVFGEGSPTAKLMFIGEGPGENEDLQGRPFVGAAGQLLDKIIEAMGLTRGDVYIANVVKCRPPGNRVPQPDEVATCEPFLFRQIETIKPKVIVALGGSALKALLVGAAAGPAGPALTASRSNDEEIKISSLRGKFSEFRGAKLMPTFHPAFLLRNPDAKKDVWEDMKKVKAELAL